MSRGHRNHVHKLPSETFWLAIADWLLIACLALVPFVMGGREPPGQLLIFALGIATGIVWQLHWLFEPLPRWRRTAIEWIGLAAIVLVTIQLVPLPASWLKTVSQELTGRLTLWNSSSESIIRFGEWSTASIAPAETARDLAILVSYVLLSIVMVQRVRKTSDAEWLLRHVALVVVAMATFGLIQFTFNNGKFFWIYEHPDSTTHSVVKGAFTSRNHFANLMAIGIAPIMWMWARYQSRDGQPPQPKEQLYAGFALIGATLTIMATAGSLSRGGIAALGVSLAVVGLGYWHLRLINSRMIWVCVFGLTGLIAALSLGNADRLGSRLEGLTTGDLNVIDRGGARRVIWQANVDLIKHFPVFGTGAGTHVDAYQLYLVPTDDRLLFTHAECGYLQIGSEMGVPGLLLLLVGMMCVLRWCFCLIRSQERELAMIGIAVLASFLASSVHAIVDFGWFVPGCMVILLAQLCIVAALARHVRHHHLLSQDLASTNRDAPSGITVPRWEAFAITASIVAGAIALAEPVWLPVVAQQDWIDYRRISTDEPEDPVELTDHKEWMARLALDAAREDPSDIRKLMAASRALVDLFNIRQETSDNAMRMFELAEAASGQARQTVEQRREWLERATDGRIALLYHADKMARRAVRLSPFHGEAYLQLAQLTFLHGLPGQDERIALLDQATRVRPHDPSVLFERGIDALKNEELDKAVSLWKEAYPRSRRLQVDILHSLAHIYPAEKLANLFPVTVAGWQRLVQTYANSGQQEEYSAALGHYAKSLAETAPAQLERHAIESWRKASLAYEELGEIEQAEACLTSAFEAFPESIPVRGALAKWYFQYEKWDQAVVHLDWCHRRQPTTESWQRMLDTAYKRKVGTALRTIERK